MAKSPFEKKKNKYASHPVQTKSELPTNDLNSINGRKAKRQALNFDTVSLEVSNPTTTKHFQRDFTALVKKYPHHEHLIKQLLAGANEDIGKRLVTFQTHQEEYYAIEDFIEFANSDEPLQKQVNCIGNVDFQISKLFTSWLLRRFPKRAANRKRYGRLRAIVVALQKNHSNHPDVGIGFHWPSGPANCEKQTESYSTEVFNRLVEASISDITYVMNMMSNFRATVATAGKLSDEKLSLENLMYMLFSTECRMREAGEIKPTRPKHFLKVIRKSVYVHRYITEQGMSIEEFIALYRDRGHDFAKNGRPIHGGVVTDKGLIDNLNREQTNSVIISTVASLFPDWPFYMALKDADNLFSYEWLNSIQGNRNLHSRAARTLFRMQVGPENKILEIGKTAYISNFFFTFTTLYPFFIYVQLNTGWNHETVLSLTDCLDNHIEQDIVDEHYVLIYGSKQRNKSAPCHRSNKKSPLSVYRILRFIETQITIFKDSPHYRPGLLWQAVVAKNLWNKFGYIVAPFGYNNSNHASVAFLNRHNIIVDPAKKRQTIEAKRLRTTYETKRREQGLSLEEVSNILGHASIETTEINYDSDEASTELKNRRIRKLQDKLVDDFQNYQARLIENKSLSDLRQAISKDDKDKNILVSRISKELGVEEGEVIHMIAPEGQTYIAACINSKAPTWPNARNFVLVGNTCRYFNRCCMCDKGVIFKEALPYIARRIDDLEDLKTRFLTPEWLLNYGDESVAWQSILENWSNQKEVLQAKFLSKSDAYCLPLAMRGI